MTFWGSVETGSQLIYSVKNKRSKIWKIWTVSLPEEFIEKEKEDALQLEYYILNFGYNQSFLI